MTLISAILSVFNGKKHLDRCLNSIMSQSLQQWELIVVDDGSNDGSRDIIERYAFRDERLIILNNDQNVGLARSLNKAIKFAKTEFILRVDVDDINHPTRFETLYKYIIKKPEIDVLGSNANLIDDNGVIIGKSSVDTCSESLKKNIFLRNPFIHSSVIMRKKFLEKNYFYNDKLIKAQDYDLWIRGAGIKGYCNIPDVLLDYNFRNSKTVKDDYYGFYVIFINCIRQKKFLSIFFYCIRYLLIAIVK